MKSAMEFPHQVYLLRHDGGLYVGITSSLPRRMEQHKMSKSNVVLLNSFTVPTRREAEGVEACLHGLQRKGFDVESYFSIEYFNLHSLWFRREHKGYPKYLVQKPQLKF